MQVSSKLSINFGLRYTYHGVLHDAKDNITNFVPGSGFLVPGSGIDSLYPKDLNNFAPRFGFAYTPTLQRQDRNSWRMGRVLRCSCFEFLRRQYGTAQRRCGGSQRESGRAEPGLHDHGAERGVPIGSASVRKCRACAAFGVFGVSQDFRTPYVQNFNLNVQRQLSSSTILQAGYVGSMGRKLPVMQDINQPIGGVRPYAAQYPQLATIDMAFSMTNSNYNSFQAQLRQALWRGLAAIFNYTWGHAIDNTSDVRNTVPTNSYDLANERGRARSTSGIL